MSNASIAPIARATPKVSLTPRPGRSLLWIIGNAARGTWFLILVHLGALASFWTDPTRLDWLLFAAFVLVRGYTTTVAYHRFFAHRSFKTTRTFQFILACLCCTNLQRGPLWWAAIHRHHHRHSDEPGDAHSPVQGGFIWGYFGWMFFTLEQPDWGSVRDLRRYPELVWLEKWWLMPPLLMAAGCWFVGGWATVCLCFCMTAVTSLHGASVVNTLGHLVGSRRYATPDQSRNSFVLALLSLGDGWHNNHHHYPHAARAGFLWWEIDSSYQLVRVLAFLGLVWDVREVPPHKLSQTAPQLGLVGERPGKVAA